MISANVFEIPCLYPKNDHNDDDNSVSILSEFPHGLLEDNDSVKCKIFLGTSPFRRNKTKINSKYTHSFPAQWNNFNGIFHTNSSIRIHDLTIVVSPLQI